MRNTTKRISATYRIVTPMFCSGAQSDRAELRLSSFKGALRFWWRSLMYGNINDEKQLQKLEASIFGAADNDFGQSKVRLRLVQQETRLDAQVNKGQQLGGGRLNGANYFGYGVLTAYRSPKNRTEAGELTRPMIPGGEFTVEVSISPAIDDEAIESLRGALILMGSVGGLGSKSRKGFGSLTLTRLSDGASVWRPESLDSLLQSMLAGSSTGTPKWTAWSNSSRVIVIESPDISDPLQLLDVIGREQIFFRSWGNNGKVLYEPREANFASDHDLSKQPNQGDSPPDRIAFGLPHNYQTGDVKPQNHDRRASPLFIHIHQIAPDDRPVAVVSFLPALFLPDGEQIKTFGKSKRYSQNEDFWYPVHAFMDRLINSGQEPGTRPGYEKFPTDSTWWKKKTGLQGKEVNLG